MTMSDIAISGQSKTQSGVLPRTGEVYSYTIVQNPPETHNAQAPYTLALVKLDNGSIITSQITDLEPGEHINIGDRVEMVTRKLATQGPEGIIIYGYKFRKIIDRS